LKFLRASRRCPFYCPLLVEQKGKGKGNGSACLVSALRWSGCAQDSSE
jgi:hypothetical protein